MNVNQKKRGPEIDGSHCNFGHGMPQKRGEIKHWVTSQMQTKAAVACYVCPCLYVRVLHKCHASPTWSTSRSAEMHTFVFCEVQADTSYIIVGKFAKAMQQPESHANV